MLVERLQVTEDPEKAFPSNADCFAVHEGSAGMGTTLSSSKVEGRCEIRDTIAFSGVGCRSRRGATECPKTTGLETRKCLYILNLRVLSVIL
jgi:hypothetical protein